MASEAVTALIPPSKTMSIKEVLSLADNVESWSHDDMRLAAKAMRGMSNAFQTCDLIRIDR
jgi:hypothetical protein